MYGIPKLTKFSNSNTLSSLLQMHEQTQIHCRFYCKCMGKLKCIVKFVAGHPQMHTCMVKMWHEYIVKCECIVSIFERKYIVKCELIVSIIERKYIVKCERIVSIIKCKYIVKCEYTVSNLKINVNAQSVWPHGLQLSLMISSVGWLLLGSPVRLKYYLLGV